MNLTKWNEIFLKRGKMLLGIITIVSKLPCEISSTEISYVFVMYMWFLNPYNKY